jgi:hypothetical protein
MEVKSLNELRTMFRCVTSAHRRGLSSEQVDWLMAESRWEYFLLVMATDG